MRLALFPGNNNGENTKDQEVLRITRNSFLRNRGVNRRCCVKWLDKVNKCSKLDYLTTLTLATKTSTIPLDSPRFIQVPCRTQNVPNATEHELDRQFENRGGVVEK